MAQYQARSSTPYWVYILIGFGVAVAIAIFCFITRKFWAKVYAKQETKIFGGYNYKNGEWRNGAWRAPTACPSPQQGYPDIGAVTGVPLQAERDYPQLAEETGAVRANRTPTSTPYAAPYVNAAY
uniref:Uncharacterized protein n=1 Tax=Eutreptiella gymnastica TaxID=73025 RepID=A0A6U8B1Z4_9EUGL